MAKACAHLCRQCCFIDGFGEFGERLKQRNLPSWFSTESEDYQRKYLANSVLAHG